MENMSNDRNYVGYDYLEVKTNGEYMSMYLDGYRNLGWTQDENHAASKTTVRLKRDRKIMNKQELTRLQRHFEACMEELLSLKKTKSSAATVAAVFIAVTGTVLLAGSVFAVTATPPILWLTILLGVPGLAGWVLPFPIHKRLVRRDENKIAPLIEAKYDEIYEICEKASKLIP